MSRKSRGQPRVLLIDDEPDLLELLELTLSRMGARTARAHSVAHGSRHDPRGIRRRSDRLSRYRSVRPLPHRYAAPGRPGPACGRAYQPEGSRPPRRGDHRDGEVETLLVDMLDHTQARAVREPHIGEAEGERFGIEKADRFGDGFRAGRVETHARQSELEQFELPCATE